MKNALSVVFFLLIVVMTASAQSTGSSSPTTWEGLAAEAEAGEFPSPGFWAASNAFAPNTQILIQNPVSGATIQVMVTKGLYSGTNILLTLSTQAATALGLSSGQTLRVRVTVVGHAQTYSSDSRLDLPFNPDPEIVPLAEIVDPNSMFYGLPDGALIQQLLTGGQSGSGSVDLTQATGTETPVAVETTPPTTTTPTTTTTTPATTTPATTTPATTTPATTTPATTTPATTTPVEPIRVAEVGPLVEDSSRNPRVTEPALSGLREPDPSTIPTPSVLQNLAVSPGADTTTAPFTEPELAVTEEAIASDPSRTASGDASDFGYIDPRVRTLGNAEVDPYLAIRPGLEDWIAEYASPGMEGNPTLEPEITVRNREEDYAAMLRPPRPPAAGLALVDEQLNPLAVDDAFSAEYSTPRLTNTGAPEIEDGIALAALDDTSEESLGLPAVPGESVGASVDDSLRLASTDEPYSADLLEPGMPGSLTEGTVDDNLRLASTDDPYSADYLEPGMPGAAAEGTIDDSLRLASTDDPYSADYLEPGMPGAVAEGTIDDSLRLASTDDPYSANYVEPNPPTTGIEQAQIDLASELAPSETELASITDLPSLDQTDLGDKPPTLEGDPLELFLADLASRVPLKDVFLPAFLDPGFALVDMPSTDRLSEDLSGLGLSEAVLAMAGMGETSQTTTVPATTETVVLVPTTARPPETTQTTTTQATTATTIVRPVVTTPATTAALTTGSLYIQVGVFSQIAMAERIRGEIGPRYPVVINPVQARGATNYRVLVGPLNEDESDTMLFLLRSRGYPDAFRRTAQN